MIERIGQTISRIIEIIKALFLGGTLLEQSQQIKVDEYRQRLLQNDRYHHPKRLNQFEWGVISQNGEDGIIHEIFNRIGVDSRIFVEIGAGDGRENNTAFWLLQGWRGFWIEADRKSVRRISRSYQKPISQGRLKVISAYVTAENVIGVMEGAQIPHDIDLLSLDIDRNTYWIWAALPALKPRVVVVEYNAAFPPPIEWIVEYDAMRLWDGSRNFGASLKSYEQLGNKLGYNLVGCDLTGVNAFFVRSDLTGDYFDQPFTAEHHFEPARYFLKPRKREYPPFFVVF